MSRNHYPAIAREIAVSLPVGVSARMVDWWIRRGYIKLGDQQLPGSGTRRVLSDSQVAALLRYAERWAAWSAEADELHSGAAWAQACEAVRDADLLHGL